MAAVHTGKYFAFGEKPYERLVGRELVDDAAPLQTGDPHSERSFGSNSSRWSIPRTKDQDFSTNVAHGIWDAKSLQSSSSDGVLHELDSMMPATLPRFEAQTAYEHPRRQWSPTLTFAYLTNSVLVEMSLYLEGLKPGLPLAQQTQRPKATILEDVPGAYTRVIRAEDAADHAEQAPLASHQHATYTKQNVLFVIALMTAMAMVTIARMHGFDLMDIFMPGLYLFIFVVVVACIFL